MQEVDEHEDQEDAADDGEHRALGYARDLLRDLGLGELDLLADEQRGLLRDLGDDLAERLLGGAGGRCAVPHAQLSPPSFLRTLASTKPPTNAAPAIGSGSPPLSDALWASRGDCAVLAAPSPSTAGMSCVGCAVSSMLMSSRAGPRRIRVPRSRWRSCWPRSCSARLYPLAA